MLVHGSWGDVTDLEAFCKDPNIGVPTYDDASSSKPVIRQCTLSNSLLTTS